MGFPIKLSEIIGVMDTQPEDSAAYVNKKTGEIVAPTEEAFTAAENEDPLEEYPEWQQVDIKTAREILDHEEDYYGEDCHCNAKNAGEHPESQ